MVYCKKLTLAIILSSIGITPAIRTEENPYVVGGLIVGGAAVATLGIGAYLGWFDEKNQSVIEDAQKTLRDIQKQYGSSARYLVAQGIVDNNIWYIKNYYPATEDQLYHLANCMTTNQPHTLFSDYLYNLNSLISHLSSLASKISKRIKSIESKNYTDQQIHNELIAFKILSEQIGSELPLYQVLQVFFKSHQTYFNLFQREVEIRKEFVNEINIINNHHADISTCFALLKVQATSGEYCKYPLTRYVQRLQNAISRLNNQLVITSGYPQRISWCTDLKINSLLQKASFQQTLLIRQKLLLMKKKKLNAKR